MAQAPDVVVRPARVGDVADLVAMIRALAEYERAADAVDVTVPQLSEALFGPAPVVFAQVAVHAGAVVGMAIWFVSFSTWTGRHGIYLEDIFVRPSARDLGVGRALLGALAALAVARGYTRVEWSVLDWNDPAIGFYRHLGARPQEEWTVFRLSGPALHRLAAP